MCEISMEGFRIFMMWKTFLIYEEKYKMAGTKEGAKKAKAKILSRDPDFYAKIGSMGGKKSRGGGFAANPELARIAGAKGGRVSRRGKAKKEA